VDSPVFGEVGEHLNAEATVQVVDDAPFPGTSNDLGRQTAHHARLIHDVIGQLPGAIEQLISRQDLVHQAKFERKRRANLLAGDQDIGRALDAQKLLQAAVNAVTGYRTLVELRIENDRLLGAEIVFGEV
jgi:hypothetical protein